MNRIQDAFKQSKVFAAYVTAGDSDITMIRALIKGGVNLLEIGVPFSDPIADGVVIQRAMQRALDKGTNLNHVFDLIKNIRQESNIPIILFTYYNPILKPNVLQRAKQAGVDGILVVDLPFFEAEEHLKACTQLDLAPIAVIAPTTSEQRLKELAQQGRGFLYYACQKGTTGVRKDLPTDVKEKLQQIKKVTDLPVIIGFGIADRTASSAAITMADGFVVGSYFIQAIESGISADDLTQLATAINPLLGNK